MQALFILVALIIISVISPLGIASQVNQKQPGFSTGNLLITRLVSTSSRDIEALADKAGMTQKAKEIFLSANPQIDYKREDFNEHCHVSGSAEFVELGCLTPDRKIYILHIDEPSIANQTAVIAAHEMLHVAYDRMPFLDRLKIDQELEKNLPGVGNKKLYAELSHYNITEPGQRNNELHSILATEFTPLSTELENYYSQYFSDRKQLVGYHNQFEQTFNDLETQLTGIETQLVEIKAKMRLSLEGGSLEEANNLRSQANGLIREFNRKAAEYNRLARSIKGDNLFFE